LLQNISLLGLNWEWDLYKMQCMRKAVVSKLKGRQNLQNLGSDGQIIWQCIKKNIWYKNLYSTNAAVNEIMSSQGDGTSKFKRWGMF